MAIKGISRWIWKYYIKREDYDENDRKELTRKALKISKGQWSVKIDLYRVFQNRQ